MSEGCISEMKVCSFFFLFFFSSSQETVAQEAYGEDEDEVEEEGEGEQGKAGGTGLDLDRQVQVGRALYFADVLVLHVRTQVLHNSTRI